MFEQGEMSFLLVLAESNLIETEISCLFNTVPAWEWLLNHQNVQGLPSKTWII